MVADFNTMPKVFSECNRKFFNHELPNPKFGLMNKLHVLARFKFLKDKNNNKKPLKVKEIIFSDCYDFNEEDFINLMVHEMIHYYIAWNRIKDNSEHGKVFMSIANDLNDKYGLNVTKRIDASSFVKTDNAPKYNGLLSILFG